MGGATPGRLGEGLGGRTPLPVGGGRTPAWGAGAGGRSMSVLSTVLNKCTDLNQHQLILATHQKRQCGVRVVLAAEAVLQPTLLAETAAAQ